MGIAPGIAGRGSLKARSEIAIQKQGLIVEAFPRMLVVGQSVPTTQQIYAVAVGLLAGDVATNGHVIVTTLGVGTAPTLIKMALLDKTGKVLALSADTSASAIWTTTVGPKTVAFAAPYTVPADDIYYVAFLENGAHASTALQIGRLAGQAANQVNAIGTGSVPFAGQATQTDFAAVGSSQTLTVIGSVYPWVGIS